MSTIEKKSLKVGKYVDNDHVNTVISNYKKERWVHNSKRLGKEDSLSVWYSAEELQEFIETIREHGADGIRMYFAAYPNEEVMSKGKDGRQSIVLVATRSKEENGKRVNKDVYTYENGKATIMAYNMGDYCPPLCAGGLGSALGVVIVNDGKNGLSVI